MMDAVALLRDQAAVTDSLMTQVFAKVTTPEQALWRLPGATTNPIAATYLHAYMTEDRSVQRQLGRPALCESDEWRQLLGYGPSEIWTMQTSPNLDVCRDYAAAVRASTVRFLDGLNPNDERLEQQVQTPRGTRPLGDLLSLALVMHKFGHMGEIAALLGCQGEKGFPF